MEIYRNIAELPGNTGSFLTIGSFDGLHRGHQEIIKKTVSYAQAQEQQSVVITFDPHPRHVLGNTGDPLPLIMGIEQKIAILEQLQVDQLLIIPFTGEFSQMTAADFLDEVVIKYFAPQKVIIGYDHHFGHRREGSPEFSQGFLEPRGIDVEIIAPFRDENLIISSTHIRELIMQGFVRRASFELGWVYGFEAQVVSGAGRGRELNYPTANFIPLVKNQLLPGPGVYLTRGRLNSKNIYGMCNLGTRPTFGEDIFVMEVHFFGESDHDLYGTQITIEFLERIRDEHKFSSPAALIKQLNEDKKSCLLLISKYK